MRKKHSLSNQISASRKDVFACFEHIEAALKPSENDKLNKILIAYKKRLSSKFSGLDEQWEEIHTTQQESLAAKNQEINNLRKDKETVVSNNYLLEYKKKDLMLLADQLEDAYDEISKKNTVLTQQKKQILEQAEKINESNKKILKKNEELEQQKEFILDQAEYLEDANKRLQKMHAELEKQKDEILKKNQELIELNNEKNNLIHIVTHDLKSPLNQIKGLITIVKSGKDELSTDSLQCLDMMENSANNLSEMIAKILDLEAIESQKLNIKSEQTNLSLISQDSIERFKLTASNKQIKLIYNIQSEVFSQLDKGFFNQVLENLLSNAIKFSVPNTNIYFNLLEKDGSALIEVKDQGPGISEEDRRKMFRKFQKLSARPTGNETSSGLGLSIVKQFVEAMDGQIWCESELGKGTSFFVKFKALCLNTTEEEQYEPTSVN